MWPNSNTSDMGTSLYARIQSSVPGCFVEPYCGFPVVRSPAWIVENSPEGGVYLMAWHVQKVISSAAGSVIDGLVANLL